MTTTTPRRGTARRLGLKTPTPPPPADLLREARGQEFKQMFLSLEAVGKNPYPVLCEPPEIEARGNWVIARCPECKHIAARHHWVLPGAYQHLCRRDGQVRFVQWRSW